jgi:prepilin-type N-terminal cleavage/methylation domain-containing protein
MDSALSPAAERGFTLIEMLIVMLVVGILASVMLPNYHQATFKAQAADMVERVHTITVAIKNYEADGGTVPAGAGPAGSPPAYLAPYVPANLFQGAVGITLQLTGPSDGMPPTLLMTNGSDPGGRQILLAAAGMLGSAAYVMGDGQSVGVTLIP